MNKRQQMRWSEAGAKSLLRLRTAVINGDLKRLRPANSPSSRADQTAMARAA